MFQLFTKWLARYKIARAKSEIRERFKGCFVELDVVPGVLTLESINPDQEQIGYFRGSEVKFYSSFWDGRAHFGFWGGELQLVIHTGRRPTESQLRLAKDILAHSDSIREAVESAILERYASEVYEKIDFGDGRRLPPPTEAKQVLKLVHGPSIQIADGENDSGIRFTLGFSCDWDEEHGLDIEINDWHVVEK